MRTAARAIVIKDDTLLLMHRNKFGLEYYSLIGGGVDYGETPEQCLYREMNEETGLTIANHRLVIVEDVGAMYGIQYIYLCDYVSGEPKLQTDSMEYKISSAGDNTYTPLWLPTAQLAEVDFLPKELKSCLLGFLKTGFPTDPITLKVAG